MNDPHCLENGLNEEKDHSFIGPIRHYGITPRFSDMTGIVRQHGLSLGEHTAEVLKELAYSDRQIEKLVNDHVVFLAKEADAGEMPL